MAARLETPEIALQSRPAGVPLSRWLYDEIRTAILEGRLVKGARLPSTREFADQYGVSRRTAVSVFEQLQAEGYLVSRVGSGTSVNGTLPEDLLHAARPAASLPKSATSGSDISPWHKRPARPFRPIEPALNAFPAELWARVASRRMRRLSPALLAGGNVAGYPPLREAVAHYLGASRGVTCTPDQVVIVSGIQQALDLATRLLLKRGDPVWMEDPGYIGATEIFRNAGARIIPVPVDESGLDPAAGCAIERKARLAYVTPAHQFPLGVSMTLERRFALLQWARDNGAFILEDDYDSEFRFTGRPVPGLQGLDRNNAVLYLGTFNKALFSSLRIGYMVVPTSLVDGLLKLRFQTDRYASAIPQAVLCDFITDGHFGRHLRRMRELYAARLAAFERNVERYLDGLVRMPGIQAGLNTPVFLTNGMTSKQAHALAEERGIECAPLDHFKLRRRDIRGLLLGFAAFEEHEIRRGILTLAGALSGAK